MVEMRRTIFPGRSPSHLTKFGDPAWEPPLDAFLVTSVVSWNGKGDKQRRISLTSLRLADPSADTDPGIGAASPSKSCNKTR